MCSVQYFRSDVPVPLSFRVFLRMFMHPVQDGFTTVATHEYCTERLKWHARRAFAVPAKTAVNASY